MVHIRQSRPDSGASPAPAVPAVLAAFVIVPLPVSAQDKLVSSFDKI